MRSIFDEKDIAEIMGKVKSDVKEVLLFALKDNKIDDEQFDNFLHTLETSFKSRLKECIEAK